MSKLTRENAIVPLTAGMDLSEYVGFPVYANNDGDAVVLEHGGRRAIGVLLSPGKEGEQVSVALFGSSGTVKVYVADEGTGFPLDAYQILSVKTLVNGARTFSRQEDLTTTDPDLIHARTLSSIDNEGLVEAVLLHPPHDEF
ncbi:MAG: hypothetical protein JJU00_19985 [Opitutales bacterium]|nr:hypothetical protein [Opitutales bacterium]